MLLLASRNACRKINLVPVPGICSSSLRLSPGLGGDQERLRIPASKIVHCCCNWISATIAVAACFCCFIFYILVDQLLYCFCRSHLAILITITSFACRFEFVCLLLSLDNCVLFQLYGDFVHWNNHLFTHFSPEHIFCPFFQRVNELLSQLNQGSYPLWWLGALAVPVFDTLDPIYEYTWVYMSIHGYTWV